MSKELDDRIHMILNLPDNMAKDAIQDLITKARIDELEKLNRTVEYLHQDNITDRIAQLKEQTNE